MEERPRSQRVFALISAAIGYDVLYDWLSEEEQQFCKRKIAEHANRMAEAASNNAWWRDMVQNHNWVNFAAIGIAAQALNGDWSADQVDGWRNQAEQDFGKIKIIQDLVSDGSWHEEPCPATRTAGPSPSTPLAKWSARRAWHRQTLPVSLGQALLNVRPQGVGFYASLRVGGLGLLGLLRRCLLRPLRFG